MPDFQYPVVGELYKKDFFIEESTLREILALGKEAAVPELEKIVADVLDGFDPDSPGGGEPDEDDWYHHFYFLHALYLLYELDAESSLSLLFRLLKKGHAFQEYWFGDNLYEDIPELVAKLGRNQLPALMEVINDGIYSLHSRNLVCKSLTQIASLYPDKRPAVIEFFQTHLRRILQHADNIEEAFPEDQDESHGYDIYTYLAFLVSDLEKINAVELESDIRQCFRYELVDEFVTGDEKDLNFREEEPTAFRSIFERYEDFKKWPGEHSPFHPDAENIRRRKALEEEQKRKKRAAELQKMASTRSAPPPQTPAPAGPKIERNGPCPCGSGKKYKKCCMP